MPQDQVFGKRNQRHTVVITSGKRVRTFTVRPATVFASAAVLLLFFVGYISATAYLMMRDDLIGAARTRQARIVHGYETRIAALRAQVDLAKSQQLVDQRNIEDHVKRLFDRQQKLSLRHGQLEPLFERARLAGLMQEASPVPVPMPRPVPGDKAKAGTGSTDGLAAIEKVARVSGKTPGMGRLASAYMSTGSIGLSPARRTPSNPAGGDATDPLDAVASVADSLRKLETDQVEKVDLLTGRAVRTASAIRAVLGRSGLPKSIDTIAEKLAGRPRTTADGLGGPYIRLGDPTRFDASLKKLDTALDRLESVRSAARKLPFGQPLANDIVTSPFGPRTDPFLSHTAFHPGVDLRAARGTHVHATGDGTVVFAGHDGGYGNMVEIDHGDDVHTRYGHLSEIVVDKGDHVASGDVVGYSGSTGRSTGPHLHYEVRLGGHPVNPIRFLDSGRSLQAYLRR